MKADKDGLERRVVGVDSVTFSGIFVGGVHFVDGLVSLAAPEQGFGIIWRQLKAPGCQTKKISAK